MMTVDPVTGKKGFIVSAQSGPTTFDGNPPLIIPLLAPDLQMTLFGTYQGPWDFPFQNFSSVESSSSDFFNMKKEQKRSGLFKNL